MGKDPGKFANKAKKLVIEGPKNVLGGFVANTIRRGDHR
jgi:hypothetical protein